MPRPDSTEPEEPRPVKIGGIAMWVVMGRHHRGDETGRRSVLGWCEGCGRTWPGCWGPFPSQEAASTWGERNTTVYSVGQLLDPEE